MLANDDNVLVSYTKGLRFLFRDTDNVIEAMFYPFSGKEVIRLNGQVASTGQNYKFGSSHTITSKNSDKYSIEFEVESLAKGKLKCSLYKNDNLIQEYKVYKKQLKQWPIYIVFISYGIAVGVASSYFNLSILQACLAFIPLVLVSLWLQGSRWEYEYAS